MSGKNGSHVLEGAVISRTTELPEVTGRQAVEFWRHKTSDVDAGVNGGSTGWSSSSLWLGSSSLCARVYWSSGSSSRQCR